MADRGAEKEESVVRVNGCDIEHDGCNGEFLYSGERNGFPCFTNTRGIGSLYFDGTFWKICQIGQGPSENDWNYSQNRDARETEYSSRLPNIGRWTKEQAHQDESPVSYVSTHASPRQFDWQGMMLKRGCFCRSTCGWSICLLCRLPRPLLGLLLANSRPR